eukprot:9163734-Ditylum_brightwellii.AAC.1
MEPRLTDSSKIIYEMKTFAEDVPPPPTTASAFTIVSNQQMRLPPRSLEHGPENGIDTIYEMKSLAEDSPSPTS